MTIQQANATMVMVYDTDGASRLRQVGLLDKSTLRKVLARELRMAGRMGRPLDMATIAACALRGVS